MNFSHYWGGGKAMKDRTKVDISTALTTLLAKKTIDDITVREIVELCEIRRQTFYYHFADIYALMDWTLELYGKPCRIRMWKNGCRNPTNKRKRIFI